MDLAKAHSWVVQKACLMVVQMVPKAVVHLVDYLAVLLGYLRVGLLAEKLAAVMVALTVVGLG